MYSKLSIRNVPPSFYDHDSSTLFLIKKIMSTCPSLNKTMCRCYTKKKKKISERPINSHECFFCLLSWRKWRASSIQKAHHVIDEHLPCLMLCIRSHFSAKANVDLNKQLVVITARCKLLLVCTAFHLVRTTSNHIYISNFSNSITISTLRWIS